MRTSAHYIDWANKPAPFKVYSNLHAVPLPHDFPHPMEVSLKAIKSVTPQARAGRIDIGVLAELLFFSAGLTRRMKLGGGSYYMRAAPATGALYPVELYVICGDITGLEAGVYHFNPLDFSLVRIREGDYRAELGAMSDDSVLTSPVTIAFTSLAWRNAWKYEARSYRHWFWDAGVIVANLLATSASAGLEIQILKGFVDSVVNRLLCVEERKEAAVALAPVGVGLDKPTGEQKKITQIPLSVAPLSKVEIDYPIIWETHEASSLLEQSEVKAWVQARPVFAESSSNYSRFPSRQSNEDNSGSSLGDVILRRGSARRFALLPISFEQLSATVDASTAGIPLDFLPRGESLIDLYLTVNEVQGLQPGAYFYNRKGRAFEQLRAGGFRQMAGYLCLEQPLFSDASVVFYLMTNLMGVLKALGNRGYRAAQFEAGVVAGKIYLSAYSLGIGASGSTFYDDAVTEFFSPHAKGKDALIATAVGVTNYKARPGRVLPQFGGATTR